ncbi:MAG: hypothetical protein MI757_21520 [Pirellulales bacterium]|nr:hypothetical protein [Pirellulales bacterium]
MLPPNLFGGDATRQSAEEEFHGNVPDESKDDLAIRLRTAGLTFREIGAQMGVDPSMAHRRVKRAMMRRRCEMQDRMEDVRDLEFEKLRVAERALMPQVAEGDHDAIRLLLRIIELRKRYLKDLPYERIKEDPWKELMADDEIPGVEDDNPLEEPAAEETSTDDQTARDETDSPSEAERRTAKQTGMIEGTEWYLNHEVEPGTPLHQAIASKLAVLKKLRAQEEEYEKEASKGASTRPSKKRSTVRSTSQSMTKATSKRRTTQSRKGAKNRKGKS